MNQTRNNVRRTLAKATGSTAVAALTALAVLAGAAPANAATTTPKTGVQSDPAVHAMAVGGSENDPMRSQQWALNSTSFESSWSMTKGQGIIVAVIDSGVEASHQDLKGSVLPGKDYVNPNDDGRIDPDGHGTHVAGIIAAHINNALGIDGAAPGVKILPVRVLDAHGSGVSSNVAKGIVWAADHGARVINLSLGGDKSASLQQAIRYANRKHAVVVAAGGNNAQAGNAPMYPAAFPETIAVASVDSNLSHSVFSNTGSYLDVSAPGDTIVSAWGTSPTAYASASGTSMATPYVAAEAALVTAAAPKLSPSRVKKIIESTTTNLGNTSLFGHGLINPALAVLKARAFPTAGRVSAAQLHRQQVSRFVYLWVCALLGHAA